MNTVFHNRVCMDCVLPEYREIRSAFARDALNWSFTIGEVLFPEEGSEFLFDTWDRAEPLWDGSMETLSRMFPAVIFRYFGWISAETEAETPIAVWCAGGNVSDKTKEELATFRDRAYLEYCKRFLRYDRLSGEGYAHKVCLSGAEDHSAVSWGENRFGECEVYYWDSLKALGCGDFHTAGNRSDGRTVATGSNANGQCNVEEFRNADSLACGRYHTAALKKVGSVLLASTDERFAQCNTWRGIVGLRSVGDTLIGIKRDGTVLIDGDLMCPCSREEIRDMFPDMKLTFPAGFKSLAAKITSEDKRKERAAEAALVKKTRKAPASAVELDDDGKIPERSKKAKPIKLDDTDVTVTFAYADMLRAMEAEFCGEEPVPPYYAPDAAKYMDRNGVPPSGDNCKRVSEEQLRSQIREFFMVCRLCTNKNFLRVLVENAARSSTGKLIKNRSQRITTFRLTHGEEFYELCARNVDGETLEINVVPVECMVKNCRGLTAQPDSRAVLEQYCSIKLD